MKIGLLGGSFNPAHAGHVHVSLEAMKRLGLDEVWWLVSPQNPLKTTEGMASYEQRRASAQRMIAGHPSINICEIEQENNLQYTAETLRALKQTYRRHRFVWLMGSDNLAQFHRWKGWRTILHTVPVCVMDRAPHSHRALRSITALSHQKFRIPARALAHRTEASLPCWAYLFIPRHKQSATALRNQLGKKAFLAYNAN